MRRIMVLGQPGSGKSTLALALGRRTGLPVVHLDRLHWLPGWVERPRQERLRLLREAEAAEAWIMDGNYAVTWGSRARRADLIVWLDRHVATRLWRVTLRLWRDLGRSRADLPEGCPERIGRNTLQFYRYIWTTRRSGRDDLAGLAAAAPCRVVRLGSDEEVAAFLKDGPGTRGPPDPSARQLGPGEGPGPLPGPEPDAGGSGGSRGSPRLPSSPPSCHARPMPTIRLATPLDIAEVDALLARSYGPLLRADYPPSVLVMALPRMARAQPRLLASGHYFVAEEGGRLVGAGGWSREDPRGGAAPKVGHVRHVATDAAQARRGVGRAVMEAVIEDAAHHGMGRLLCLSTLTAVPFYRALRFAERGRVALRFGGLDFPAVEMERGL